MAWLLGYGLGDVYFYQRRYRSSRALVYGCGSSSSLDFHHPHRKRVRSLEIRGREKSDKRKSMRIAPRNFFFSRRAAINLSMEFLVVIVISLVVLGMGVTLLYKFLGGAEDVKRDLDKRTEDELRRLLTDEGKPVALPLHLAELSPGEKHIFGLGILNVENEEKAFYLSIEKVKVADEQNNPLPSITFDQVRSWLLYTRSPLVLKKGEKHFEPIMVQVPKDAVKGTYLFDVVVRKDAPDGEQYWHTKKFIVVVK